MYRVLRGLMAKYDMTQADLAKICGIALPTLANKISGKVDFSLSEANKIKEYFNQYGERLTIEEIFFTKVSTIIDK